MAARKIRGKHFGKNVENEYSHSRKSNPIRSKETAAESFKREQANRKKAGVKPVDPKKIGRLWDD